MSGDRQRAAAALALEMRAPLARVELAADRLGRGAHTPAERGLAEGIAEAVAELDALVDRALWLLLPRREAEAAPLDLGAVFTELRERLAPVLAARAVRWEPGGVAPPAVRGAPELLRAACLALVRTAAELAGPGGCFAIDGPPAPEQPSLELRVQRADGAASLPDAPCDALRAALLGHGLDAELETRESGLLLRLPPEAPCPAS